MIDWPERIENDSVIRLNGAYWKVWAIDSNDSYHLKLIAGEGANPIMEVHDIDYLYENAHSLTLMEKTLYESKKS